MVANFITSIIHRFYKPPISKLMPCHTFRYAVVGGLNLVFGVLLYWLLFNIVLDKQDTDFGVVTVSAPILAFLINFVVTFFTGFWLTRKVAFSDSIIPHGKQLFRYAQIVALNIGINYLGLKLFVEVLNFYPTPSYMGLQMVTVCVSYIASRHYTFK